MAGIGLLPAWCSLLLSVPSPQSTFSSQMQQNIGAALICRDKAARISPSLQNRKYVAGRACLDFAQISLAKPKHVTSSTWHCDYTVVLVIGWKRRVQMRINLSTGHPCTPHQRFPENQAIQHIWPNNVSGIVLQSSMCLKNPESASFWACIHFALLKTWAHRTEDIDVRLHTFCRPCALLSF